MSLKPVFVQTLKAALLDSLFVFYAFVVLDRVIYGKFILQLSDRPVAWNQIGAAFIVSAAAGSLWAATRTSPGSRLCALARRTRFSESIVEASGFFLFTLTFIAGWIVTGVSLVDLFDHEGIQGARRIFSAIVRPEFSLFDEALFAMIETIYIALLATIISIPPALFLSFLMARNIMKKSRPAMLLYSALRILANFLRSVEPLIWAIIFSVWVGIGAYAGMLALLVHTIASNTKLYSEAIENVNEGPIEAIAATGANKVQIVWFGILPQVVLPFISFTIYRWDINVRMATVIGLVGGGGIGTLLIQYQGLAKWREVGLIVFMIAVVVWIFDYVSAKIRESLA